MTASIKIREIVVVTGASSGIGAATARELAKRGYHVLAGVRRDMDADAIRAANLEPVMLDITNHADVATVLKRVTEDPKRRPLRALVNNAGIQINAPVETLPLGMATAVQRQSLRPRGDDAGTFTSPNRKPRHRR